MKKNLVITFCLLFILYGRVFAQNANKIFIWVMPTETKGLTVAEANWLPEEVHNALRANITNYSGLTVVEENSELLADIQEKTYNENISENDAVKMGKQIGANHIIRSTITKVGKEYSLNIIMQTLEDGTHLAESNQIVKNVEDLYGKPGCAVNEATIELCERLYSKKIGTGLSSWEKTILRKGDATLSDEEERAYYKEVEKKQKELIESLNKKIATLEISTSEDAAAEAARLKVEIDQAEEKQKQAAEKSKRLEAEEKKRQEDLELQKKRSKKQQERISKTELEIKEKVKKLREADFHSSNLFTQISSIEAKKKAVLEIRANCAAEEERLINEYVEEKLRIEDEIMNAPLAAAQKNNNGQILPKVEQARRKQFEKEDKKLVAERDKAINETKKIAAEGEKELFPQIKAQSNSLTEKRTADNIKKDLDLVISNYDGQAEAWNAYVTLLIDGQAIYSYSFKLYYEKLTGKKANVASTEYIENVDYYSSLFAKSIPVTVKLNYNVEACPSSEPSCYRFNIESLQASHTENGKVFETFKINTYVKKQFSPIYDIRDDSVIRQAKSTRDYYEGFEEKFAGRLGIGGGVSYDLDSNLGFDVWGNIPITDNFYIGANLGILPMSPTLENYTKYKNAFYWDLGFGVNKRLLFWLPPNLYAFAGIGVYNYSFKDEYYYIEEYEDSETSYRYYNDSLSLGCGAFLLKANVGTEIPLYTPSINLVFDASVSWVPKFKYLEAKATIGLSLSYKAGEWLKSIKY